MGLLAMVVEFDSTQGSSDSCGCGVLMGVLLGAGLGLGLGLHGHKISDYSIKSMDVADKIQQS